MRLLRLRLRAARSKSFRAAGSFSWQQGRSRRSPPPPTSGENARVVPGELSRQYTMIIGAVGGLNGEIFRSGRLRLGLQECLRVEIGVYGGEIARNPRGTPFAESGGPCYTMASQERPDMGLLDEQSSRALTVVSPVTLRRRAPQVAPQ
jgi:hypothetical protein